MKLFVILLFAATYVAMIALPKWRYLVALGSAAIMIVSGALPVTEAFGQIDWNVLMMLAGTMGTVSLFIASKMPERMADLLLKKTPNILWVAVALSVFAGLISAFVDNVATVLMVAPVALAIATKLGTSPIPLLICIAVSSNLQGAATLVGDTTSIMLGGAADMNFMDFIFMDGKLSIFWAVELGALATVPVIMFIFRKERGTVTVGEPAKVEDYVPSCLLLGTVVLLIAASFLPNRPALTNGFICMGVFVIGILYTLICKKSSERAKNAFKEIDFETILLLAGFQNVNPQYCTAARVDGAKEGLIFRRITLPLIAPTIGLTLIVNMISASKVFSELFPLFNGQPGTAYSLYTVVYYLYDQFYVKWKLGRAAASAVILFAIVLVLTMIQLFIQRKWKNY